MTETAHEAKHRFRFRLPRRITAVSWLDLAEALGGLLVLSALSIYAALHFVRPAPPDTLSMAAGPEGSTFRSVAERYQKILARSGITLKIVPSEGSLDNLKRLADPTSGIDIALVQSGIAAGIDTSDLVSLGSLFYQPELIFYHGHRRLERLSQLRGRRIAIGPEGSGTRVLALALLKANDIEPQGPTQLLDLDGDAARDALLARQADAIFLSGDSVSWVTIQELIHAPGIHLFDFAQADAYGRRFRYLSRLDLPPGTFDLGRNLPATPITLFAPTVELLARSRLHPALSDLLIDAATEVHGQASLLQNARQFPAPVAHDVALSADAARFYKSGKSFAYHYLPFWLATLIDRALVVLVPIVIVVIPGLRYLPQLYAWRINSRIHRRYGELMAVEREALGELSPPQRAALLERVAAIEKAVIARQMPGSHADQIYLLRQHINFARERIARSAAPAEPVAPAERADLRQAG